MANILRRQNETLLHWLRAAGVAIATYAGLALMMFEPGWGAAAFALLAGLLSVASIDLGVIVSVVALSLPVMAANAIIGIAFLVIGLLCVRYLGANGGRVFLLVAAAIAGVALGPAWAVVAIAGFLMGATEGALAAAAACIAIQGIGVVLGSSAQLGGVVVNSGTQALAHFGTMPSSMFSTLWVAESFGAIDAKMAESLLASVTAVQHPLALLLQPAIWAGGAAATAALVDVARRRDGLVAIAAAVALGCAVPALGSAVLYTVVGVSVDWAAVGIATASSIVVAAVFAAVYERLFPIMVVSRAPVAPRPVSMATEDADVDELLRLVATAEEKLATHHTTNRVVMITDMKSFSRMTEEDGSIVTAKAIQKHRDLLLPVIEQLGGHGKSTGGDGLVAAFEAPTNAIEAAAQMQRKLDAHNRSHLGEREMSVRIGMAEGEVVLDKGGRPFIGAALNLAARVMNLADGGQAFSTAGVVEHARSPLPAHSHGEFQLKNIAEPVEVIEILWGEDQLPRHPASTGTATED